MTDDATDDAGAVMLDSPRRQSMRPSGTSSRNREGGLYAVCPHTLRRCDRDR